MKLDVIRAHGVKASREPMLPQKHGQSLPGSSEKCRGPCELEIFAVAEISSRNQIYPIARPDLLAPFGQQMERY